MRLMTKMSALLAGTAAIVGCVFRGIRPVIPTTSGHLNRGIRPPLFSGFEA